MPAASPHRSAHPCAQVPDGPQASAPGGRSRTGAYRRRDRGRGCSRRPGTRGARSAVDAAPRLRAAGQRQRTGSAGGGVHDPSDGARPSTSRDGGRAGGQVDHDDVVGPPRLLGQPGEQPAQVLVAPGGDHEDGDRRPISHGAPLDHRRAALRRRGRRGGASHAVGSSRLASVEHDRAARTATASGAGAGQAGARPARRPAPAARRTGAASGTTTKRQPAATASATAAQPALVTTTSARARSDSIGSRPCPTHVDRPWRHGCPAPGDHDVAIPAAARRRATRPARSSSRRRRRAGRRGGRPSQSRLSRRGAAVEAAERPAEEPAVVDGRVDRLERTVLGDPHDVGASPARSGGRDRVRRPLWRTVTVRSPSSRASTVTSTETSTTAVVQSCARRRRRRAPWSATAVSAAGGAWCHGPIVGRRSAGTSPGRATTLVLEHLGGAGGDARPGGHDDVVGEVREHGAGPFQVPSTVVVDVPQDRAHAAPATCGSSTCVRAAARW